MKARSLCPVVVTIGARMALSAAVMFLPIGCAMTENVREAPRTDTGVAGAIESQSEPEDLRPETTDIELAPPAVRINPQTLVGLDEEQIKDVLGTPSTIKEEPPSRVWGYDIDSCTLDLFFYLDLGTRKFRALTYSVRTFQKPRREKAVEACVGRIQTKNRGQARKS